MKPIEKRLLKLEKIVKNKYNHSGVFLVFIKDNHYTLQNYEDRGKSFASKESLENYIYSKYSCDKYIFHNFNLDKIKILP